MASFKPANRFRTAAAKPLKENYTDLRVTSDKSSTSLSLATSSQFIAVPYGGGTSGSLAVLPVKYSLWSRNNNYPVVCAHGETVQDLQFNPFNPHQLATGGKDGVFKVFTIPEGGLTENLVDPTLKLTDFDGGVTSIAFHKSASGILAVGYKNGVNIVDLNKGASAYNFKHGGGFNKDLLSVDWSYDGTLLGGIGKDQAFHLFDPRSSAAEVLTTSPKIELRAQRGLFLGKDGSFVIVGANKSRQPQINIFDSRNPAKALLDTSLDFSTGTLLPLYDVDTQLMYLGIRGSAMMNVYDMSETGKITKVTQFSTPTLFQGAALLPKSTVEFKSAEINRVLKLTDTAVEQISIQIPKKIAAPFHEDLYPETASAKSDLSGEDWLAGKNALPTLVNIQTLASVPAAEEKAASPAPQSSPSASPSPSPVPAASPRSPEPAKTEAPKVIFNKSDNRKQLEAAMKKSPFTHISGTEPNSINAYYYDIAADLNMTLARNLRVNSKYWAVAWKTIGGSGICVHPHGAFGRIGGTGVSPPLIRGHSSQVTCFDLSTIPSQSSLLASGSGDCHVRLFTIPDEGVKEDIKEGVADFSLGGRITTTDFNPYVDGILTASHSAFDGHFLSIFDINANKTASTISFFQDSVIDVSFNPLGSLFGVTSKDKKSRIIDPRANSVAQEFEPVESQRDTRILWSSGTRVVTAGFGKFSQRSIALWDLAKLDKPLKQQEIDTSNSTLLPILDADTQILYVASNGSRIVRPFHITNDTFEPLAQFVSGGDMFGFAMKPKSSVDVKAVEVGAAVSIFNSDKVMPISFKIPRKRVEYFQDDVFPPSRSAESLCSAEAWLGGAQFTESDIKTVNLCPAGMTPLSAAPPEEMTERQMKYQNVLAQKAAPKPKGILGHESADEVRDHFRNIAQTMPTSNRWDARAEDSNDVDDSEW